MQSLYEMDLSGAEMKIASKLILDKQIPDNLPTNVRNSIKAITYLDRYGSSGKIGEVMVNG